MIVQRNAERLEIKRRDARVKEHFLHQSSDVRWRGTVGDVRAMKDIERVSGERIDDSARLNLVTLDRILHGD